MILMQAFYWDCPRAEGKVGEWWNNLKSKVPALENVGITGLWLPPSAKSSHTDSMGYAPYDYYDHGEFDQKDLKLMGYQVLTKTKKVDFVVNGL